MVPPAIAESTYVRLVTLRRDGTPVPTPVWCVADGGELLIWTKTDTGKVKRLRNDTRVTVTPCDARGRTAGDAEPVEATARLLPGRSGLDRVRAAMGAKYGWKFRLLDSGAALLRRGKRPHTGIAVTF